MNFTEKDQVERVLRSFHAKHGQLPHGRVVVDFQSLIEVPDGICVGTIMGVSVYRDAALGVGRIVYKNLEGTVLATD